MRPNIDWTSLITDLWLSSFVAILRLVLTIATKGFVKSSIVFYIFNTVGTIMLGVLFGFLANKTDIDFLHNYHDLVVALGTLNGKIILDKVEVYIESQKIEKYIPGAKVEEEENGEVKPNVP